MVIPDASWRADEFAPPVSLYRFVVSRSRGRPMFAPSFSSRPGLLKLGRPVARDHGHCHGQWIEPPAPEKRLRSRVTVTLRVGSHGKTYQQRLECNDESLSDSSHRDRAARRRRAGLADRLAPRAAAGCHPSCDTAAGRSTPSRMRPQCRRWLLTFELRIMMP